MKNNLKRMRMVLIINSTSLRTQLNNQSLKYSRKQN
jgi:hypothetical protein